MAFYSGTGPVAGNEPDIREPPSGFFARMLKDRYRVLPQGAGQATRCFFRESKNRNGSAESKKDRDSKNGMPVFSQFTQK